MIVITFLPLITAALIFGRKLYLQEPLNFLLIICLLDFLRGIVELTYALVEADNILSLILLLLLVQCFRGSLVSRSRYVLDLLLSAVVAVVLTWWSLKGWSSVYPVTDMLLNGFAGVVILVSLPGVIRTSSLQLLRSPLFWIGGGALFYILLNLLLTGLAPDPDKKVFLLLAGGVRNLLFLIAALTTKPIPSRV